MAFTKINFNASLPHGALLRSALNNFESGRNGLNAVIACTQLMIDGDGSQAAHFTEVMSRYGFTDTATAKAAWEELNSLAAKLNTDAQVTSVLAAINQALAKFR